MEYDAYEGCWIQKDSIVYGNIWNMHHDEGHHRRAEEFRQSGMRVGIRARLNICRWLMQWEGSVWT